MEVNPIYEIKINKTLAYTLDFYTMQYLSYNLTCSNRMRVINGELFTAKPGDGLDERLPNSWQRAYQKYINLIIEKEVLGV